MPQMAPLSWLTLFFLFSLFIVLTSNKIWFSSPMFFNETQTSNKSSSTTSNPYLWKW